MDQQHAGTEVDPQRWPVVQLGGVKVLAVQQKPPEKLPGQHIRGAIGDCGGHQTHQDRNDDHGQRHAPAERVLQ